MSKFYKKWIELSNSITGLWSADIKYSDIQSIKDELDELNNEILYVIASGYFAGGANSNYQSYIDKLLFNNETRTTLTATLSQTIEYQYACNSSSSGYFAGGYYYDSTANVNYCYSFIDKLLFSNETRTTLTTTLSQNVYRHSACNSTLDGYFAGGENSSNGFIYYSHIDKLLFSNESRSTLAATLSQSIYYQSACNSTSSGYFAGGWMSSSNIYSFIDKLVFSNDLRTTLTATLSQSAGYQSACNSSLAGYFAGGAGSSSNYYSFIDKLLFSDDSRSTLSATLSQSIYWQPPCNSSLAGYFAGGDNSNYKSYIDKLLFSNETRTTLTATLSQSIYGQSACQSGNIL
jgi:hypothetical protein